MLKLNERYIIVDRKGKKSAVILDIEDFEGLMELLKRYEKIEAYDTEDVTRDIRD